jgi:hypothetical protein
MHINSNKAITEFNVTTLVFMSIRLNLCKGNDIVIIFVKISKKTHTLVEISTMLQFAEKEILTRYWKRIPT